MASHISDQSIAAAARLAGWPKAHSPPRSDDTLVIAVAIALSESGGNTTATNTNSDGSRDYGLWQINSVHQNLLSRGNWQDPVQNASMALSLYHASGFSPWNSSRNGWSSDNDVNRVKATIGVAKMQATLRRGKSLEDIAHSQGIIGAVKDTVDSTAGVLSALGKAADFVTDTSNWLRLGYIVGGAILILLGVIVFGRSEVVGAGTRVIRRVLS